MRIFLREASAEVKGDHAVLIADAEMVYTSKANLGPQQRRKERIQFDFNRTEKGWKIFEITPRHFFTPWRTSAELDNPEPSHEARSEERRVGKERTRRTSRLCG